MSSSRAPSVGHEVVCRYTGRNRRAQITRVIDERLVDLTTYDDAGNIRGLKEVELATTADERAIELRWWPFPDLAAYLSRGGRGGGARVVGGGIAVGGPGGRGGPYGPGGDGGDAEIDGDGIALEARAARLGQADRGGRGGRNPREALGFPGRAAS